jgi:hypothetical protein
MVNPYIEYYADNLRVRLGVFGIGLVLPASCAAIG